MMSTSLNEKGRLSQTSERTDLAWVQSPQLGRVKSVILHDWSSRMVARIVDELGGVVMLKGSKLFQSSQGHELVSGWPPSAANPLKFCLAVILSQQRP